MIYVRVSKDETNGLVRSMKKVKLRPAEKLDLNVKSVCFLSLVFTTPSSLKYKKRFLF